MEEKKRNVVKELTNDEVFILWCLAPTPELDDHWENWLLLNPGCKKAFDKAAATIKSLRLNEYELPEEKQAAIYARLKDSIESNGKEKKHISFTRRAVACVAAVAIALGISWTVFVEKQPGIAQVFNELKIEQEQNEIELILDNNQKLLLADGVTIEMDSQGRIFFDKSKSTGGIESINKTDKKLSGIFNNTNILKVPEGKRSLLLLSDGSKITVNENTIICFPTVFDTGKRMVFLDGEAFLEVAHNPEMPFIVRTSELDVKVLGTTFNVNAYTNKKEKYVVLCDGKVEVDNRENTKNILRPGDMLALQDGETNISQVDINDYTFWKDGAYLFEKKTLDDLMKTLGRYYNVSFNCSSDLKDISCSGKLILFDNIENVMNTLAESFSFNYVIKNNVIYIQ